MSSTYSIARDADFQALAGRHFPLIAAALTTFICVDVVSVVAMLFVL